MLSSSIKSRYGGATGEETKLRVRGKVTGEKMTQQDCKDVLFEKFMRLRREMGRKSEAAEEGGKF